MPTSFEIDVHYAADGTRPITVSMRAIFVGGRRRADPFAVLSRAADVLRHRVVREVRRFRPAWNKATILSRVRGLLQMVNYGDNTSPTAHTNDLALSSLDDSALNDLLDRVNSSYGYELDVYTVVWNFYIDPNSLNVGSGGVVPPGKRPGIRPDSSLPYFYCGKPVSCAAVAITLHLFYTRIDLFKPCLAVRRRPENIAKYAWHLQETLGWSEEVTVAQLADFVKLTPFEDYRIVLVEPSIVTSQAHDWSGAKYVYDGELSKRIVYLYLDVVSMHYFAIGHITAFIRDRLSSHSHRWCERCSSRFLDQNGHTCDDEFGNDITTCKKRFVPNKNCSDCGASYNPKTRHRCGMKTCKFCNLYFSMDKLSSHRCPLWKNFSKHPASFLPHKAPPDNKSYSVWVYDIESCLVPVPDASNLKFLSDNDGNFVLDEEGDVVTMTVTRQEQVPNLVCFRNLFDHEGDTLVVKSIEDFVTYMFNYNGGRNICLAHNASGYDSRIVFNALLKHVGNSINIKPILRGGKFMRLEVQNLIFLDTMLHLKGRLKDLAADFFPHDASSSKGYFPHLFNTSENQNYIGPIPAREYFDLSFSCKDDKELDEFNEWYDSYGDAPWNFQTELVTYCKQDVEVLVRIARLYHDLCVENIGAFDSDLAISPWLHPTSAGYVHQLFIRYTSKMMELDPEDIENTDKAAADNWCALHPEEYYFDRAALRGGRTDIRKFHHYIPDPAWDVGERISYVDVVSMYPFVQVANEYPVGPPIIKVYDDAFYPCYEHFYSPITGCICHITTRRRRLNRFLTVVEHAHQPTKSYLFTFFGTICCDMIPPSDLYHPVLVHYDQKNKKCVASLEPIEKGVFTSVEFQAALAQGYVVGKVYRIHEYKHRPSLWHGLLEELYKMKLYNSGEIGEEDGIRLKRAYKERFDMDIDPSRFANRPAVKQTFKILFNSAWGKHAETVDHAQSVIFDEIDSDAISGFIQTVTDNTLSVSSFNTFSNFTLFRYIENRVKVRPNLHKGYLPAALFVPAYGRLLLLEQLSKLDERVLMHDTDSIVYVKVPGTYDPPTSDIWGDWEIDKFEKKHDGIVEFVALGPKTYGLRGKDDYSTFKCKGVSIKRAHKDLLNFSVARDILLYSDVVSLPQYTFTYHLGNNIYAWNYLKDISFNEDQLKGVYDTATRQLWPLGHQFIECFE